MAFATAWRFRSGDYFHEPLPLDARRQRVLGGAALVSVAVACAWTLCVNLAGGEASQSDQTGFTVVPSDHVEVSGTRGDKLVSLKPFWPPSARFHFAWFDPHSFGPSGTFVRDTAPDADDQATAAIEPGPSDQNTDERVAALPSPAEQTQSARSMPLPVPRPPQSRPASIRDRVEASRVAANEPAEKPSLAEKSSDKPGIFERLFGKPFHVALAYAAPEEGTVGDGLNLATGRYDRETAVYDISARTVYMPDGTRLEAHSGLRDKLDDPRSADERMRGVTPPAVYDLREREALFHGVRALRLIPEDESKVYGRSGLLAHTFMLGPNGDSNGCVSFRNYDAFLQAYLAHKIKRLAVVSRLD